MLGVIGLLPKLCCGFLLGIVLADLGVLAVASSMALGVVALAAGFRASRGRWRVTCAVVIFTAAVGALMLLGGKRRRRSEKLP